MKLLIAELEKAISIIKESPDYKCYGFCEDWLLGELEGLEEALALAKEALIRRGKES